jgi:phage recombination protein Bet
MNAIAKTDAPSVDVAVMRPAKSVLIDMATRFGMEPAAFESTVRATCIKPDKTGRTATREEFAAFLLVAKEYGLNPLTKEIYAFADRGGIVPVVGVDGWANIINSHPAFDGMEFVDHADDKGQIGAITCRMHRKDRSHPIEATEYLAECKRGTEPWSKWPRRMLRHKAMIQAARYAFGFAGIYDPDEADRIAADRAQDVTPRTVSPKTLAGKLDAIAAPHDAETGEVIDGDQTADGDAPSAEAPAIGRAVGPKGPEGAAPRQGQQGAGGGDIPASSPAPDPHHEAARKAARGGTQAFLDWRETAEPPEQDAADAIFDELSATAKRADAEKAKGGVTRR